MRNVDAAEYIEAVLEKSGFLKLVPQIFNDIENNIVDWCEAMGYDEEATYDALYEDTIEHLEPLISEGVFTHRLKKELNDTQKKMLINLTKEGCLAINAERSSSMQNWWLHLQPEISINSDDRIDICARISISAFNSSKFEIEVINETEHSNVNYSELLFLTKLST